MTIIEDAITKLSLAVDELRVAALRDDKTPLSNALALNIRLKDLAAGGEAYAVIFGDINGFKAINSAHTYRGGDIAINRVGTVLAEMIRPFQDVTAYRQSGDEFMVLAPREIASKVTDALKRHLGTVDVNYDRFVGNKVESHYFTVGMSFGWAATDAGADAHTWQSRAEAACKVAKGSAAGTVVEWTTVLNPEFDTERCRCSGCGCACTVETVRGSITSPTNLFCPVCGRKGTFA